ncbi:MAG: O-antigen ligase family protein [Bacteroidales bacterium]|nr:O-antigen ligase family protein [Bacteroidales bacterium]
MEFRWTLGTGTGILFVLGYSLAVPFAVDSGMAATGIFRHLWVLLWLVAVRQIRTEERKRMLEKIPYIGVAMCILGGAAFLIPTLYDNMFANGRLGGGFQYPNTFALFLLCGLILLCDCKEIRKTGFISAGILLWGIALSGSRTVFVFTAVVMAVLLIKNRNRGLIWGAVISVAVLIVYLLLTGNTENIGRITTFSFRDSTLVGRLLYAKDALPLLLKHPLGMGHMGYYYMQNMVQTGVYSVQYVHNDLLQIGLDAGWIPMAGYVLAVIRTLKAKQVSFTNKMLLAVIFFHGLLDFDLAYGAVYLIVLMIMDGVGLRKKSSRISWKYVLAPLLLVFAGCGYLFNPLICFYHDDMEQALKWYPWHTEAKLNLLSATGRIQRAEQLAEEIWKQNDTAALPCYAKAVAAYNKADFDEVIVWQKASIERNYFDYNAYLEFAYMLYGGMLYNEGRDAEMYERCRTELLAIPEALADAKKRLGKLGSMIDEQPELELDDELRELLDKAASGTKAG